MVLAGIPGASSGIRLFDVADVSCGGRGQALWVRGARDLSVGGGA